MITLDFSLDYLRDYAVMTSFWFLYCLLFRLRKYKLASTSQARKVDDFGLFGQNWLVLFEKKFFVESKLLIKSSQENASNKYNLKNKKVKLISLIQRYTMLKMNIYIILALFFIKRNNLTRNLFFIDERSTKNSASFKGDVMELSF